MTSQKKYRRCEWLQTKYVDEKKTARDIASICEVSKTTVLNWLDRHDIERRSLLEYRRPEESNLRDESWLREMYQEREFTPAEISEKVDCDPETVRRWVERHEIEKRDLGSAQRLSTDDRLLNCDWLRRKYIDEDWTTTKIAEECDVSRPTVIRWLEKHDIKQPFGNIAVDNNLRDAEWIQQQYIEEEKTTEEIAEACGVSTTTVYAYMDRHGVERRDSGLAGEKHPNWKGGQSRYGKGWNESKRESVRERDNHTCQHPGCEISSSEHKERYSVDLHVHHITKARDFEDPEQRNSTDNLVSLCIEHHDHYEKISDCSLRVQFDSVDCDP